MEIGSGVFARTFPSRLVLTTRKGPEIEDIQRRIVRSLVNILIQNLKI